MKLEASRDDYGRPMQFTAAMFRHILELIDGYMKGEEYYIQTISQADVNDPNGRIDIEIARLNGQGMLVTQKLLILKDELVDGTEFHKRFSEWY